MIEIKMPKDINEYQPKIIGPLTLREFICISVAAAFALLIYNYVLPFCGQGIASYLMFIPAAFAYCFGWLKPYGMTFEKFVKSIFINVLIAPSVRKYKTENQYDLAQKEYYEKIDAGKTKKEKKKTKYKKSKMAIK